MLLCAQETNRGNKEKENKCKISRKCVNERGFSSLQITSFWVHQSMEVKENKEGWGMGWGWGWGSIFSPIKVLESLPQILGHQCICF